ncbi:MAG: hypothetical protein H7X70_06730 [Candidatus Kapabacteria bacterium]|nr:hypothetical protein [Candidatus Kapabacteria bacterium]
MKHSTVLLFVLLAFATPILAQEKFKVLAVRGSVTLDGSRKISVGQKLKLSEKIVVAKGGYASLAHLNGRTVEVRKEGTVKVSDLDKAVSKSTGSVSGKFASYVVGELTEVSEPIAFKDSRRSKMRTTGSVERAAGDEVNVADSILRMVGAPGELQALAAIESSQIGSGETFTIVMPRHTRLLNDTVQFMWHRSNKIARYKVVITDRDDKVVAARETTDTALTLVMKDVSVASGGLYYWHVEKSDDASERTQEYGLWLLNGQDKQTAVDLIVAVRGDMEEQSSAIGALVLATAYEDQGLFYDAYRSYLLAMKEAPDVQSYKRLYTEFLLRQSLNLEAYIAYN